MATKVIIKRALEDKIRGVGSTEQALLVVGELIKLLDAAQERAADSKPGLGYKELVALFRFHLNGKLALPPLPSTGYIVKIVNKAKEQGIGEDNVEQICRGLERGFRGPYDLWFIVNRAGEHFTRGHQEGPLDSEGGVRKNVFTGRGDDEE